MQTANPDRIAKGLYWDRAWSLVSGCSYVSEGCTNCWAAREAHMRGKQRNVFISARYAGLTADDGRWNGRVRPLEQNLDLPLRVKKPTVWAVWNDLFHPDVPFEFIWKVFDTMLEAGQHTYLILTKRPERMAKFIRNIEDWNSTEADHIWMGVTAENQEQADKRIPVLLQIPAAVRFVSVEPMLGPVDLNYLHHNSEVEIDSLNGTHGVIRPHGGVSEKLDWVICGGESGPGARPMHPDWPRNLRDQCQAAGVPFFFKQWGEFKEVRRYETYSKYADSVGRVSRAIGSIESGQAALLNADGSELVNGGPDHKVYPISHLERIGRKKAGRLLDGREWDEFPGVVT